MKTHFIPIVWLAYFFCGTPYLQGQEVTVQSPEPESVSTASKEIKAEVQKEVEIAVEKNIKEGKTFTVKSLVSKGQVVKKVQIKPVKVKPIGNIQKKEAQLKKNREKLSLAKAKLEQERLEGTLPGDYIASREAKFLKEEKRLNDLAKAIAASKNNSQVE